MDERGRGRVHRKRNPISICYRVTSHISAFANKFMEEEDPPAPPPTGEPRLSSPCTHAWTAAAAQPRRGFSLVRTLRAHFT